MVPGQMQLTWMPLSMWSAAKALVIPMTAALVELYTNRLATPLMEEATEAMLTMDPDPLASIYLDAKSRGLDQ